MPNSLGCSNAVCPENSICVQVQKVATVPVQVDHFLSVKAGGTVYVSKIPYLKISNVKVSL